MTGKGERILTVVVCAITAALIAAFLYLIYFRNSGGMSHDDFVNICVAMTSALTFIVLIYGVIMTRSSDSADKRFEEYARRRKEEEGKKRTLAQ